MGQPKSDYRLLATKYVQSRAEFDEAYQEARLMGENIVMNIRFNMTEDHEDGPYCCCEPDVYEKEDEPTVIMHKYFH